MTTVIYQTQQILAGRPLDPGLDFSLWQPSPWAPRPPDKSKRYLAYTGFHYSKIFKNSLYSAVLVREHGSLISSLLVVPAHFKWPFMGPRDVQFTYVLTRPGHRGRGLAEQAIRFAVQKLNGKVDRYWYVTDTENKPSIRLCQRLGFEFHAFGRRTGPLRVLRKSSNSDD